MYLEIEFRGLIYIYLFIYLHYIYIWLILFFKDRSDYSSFVGIPGLERNLEQRWGNLAMCGIWASKGMHDGEPGHVC